ncbi:MULTISPECIES: histidine phosphatase family protein [Bacillus]|uniref:histidine phosphatase family protein n=1 Tax=Bacillus TaxID=1386 RepID=UPI0002D5E6FC|nr:MULTISPECIES: histidine phosphatase family protein [Bacillus]
MLTIYFTRHGQTEWNVEQRLQGWGNGELTELGISDAKNLATRLNDTHIDKIYASTSKRAYLTAEIVENKRNIPIIKDDLFREMHFGSWDGVLRQEVIDKDPEGFDCFWETPHLFNREGHESFYDLQDRVKKALQLILDQNQEGTVLVVAHSIFLRMMFAIIKNLPVSDIFKQNPPGNTSLTKVIYDGNSLVIEYEGDMSHAK